MDPIFAFVFGVTVGILLAIAGVGAIALAANRRKSK